MKLTAQARGQRGEGDARITNCPPAGPALTSPRTDLAPKERRADSAAEGALAVGAHKSGPQTKRLGAPRQWAQSRFHVLSKRKCVFFAFYIGIHYSGFV